MSTLTQMRQLEQNILKVGVIEELITSDELTAMMQWKGHTGNSLVYNREATNPQAQPMGDGAEWADSPFTITPVTVGLKEVGVQDSATGMALQTIGNIQAPTPVLMSRLAKGLGLEIARQIVKGDPDVNPLEIAGLDRTCRNETRMMAMDDGNIDGPGSSETELTLARLDAFIDMIRPGKPDILIMPKVMRRKITALARAVGSGVLLGSESMLGHKFSTYDHIPIVVSDYITSSEEYADAATWPTSTATTIFAVKLGEENNGFTLLHNGPAAVSGSEGKSPHHILSPQIQDIGWLEKFNARRWRMVAYLEGLTFSTLSVAALGGIDSAA